MSEIVSFKFNNIEIPFNLDGGPSNIMVEVTGMAKAYGKKIAEWRRLPSTQKFLNLLLDSENFLNLNINSINDLIYSEKGGTNGGGGTWINQYSIFCFLNWLTDNKELKNFIIESIISLSLNNAPERCTYYGEEFIDFCYDFIDLAGENKLLKNFECFDNKKFDYPYHESRLGERTIYLIPTENNRLLKLSKEDIISISFYNLNLSSTLKVIKYLDSILEKDDITYLRFKYLIMSQLNYTTFNKDKFITSQKTYLMKDSNTGLIKIGKAVNPKFRERTLQSEKPTISLFAICDNLVERELHKKYNDKRVRGEWFKLSEDEVSKIVSKYNFN